MEEFNKKRIIKKESVFFYIFILLIGIAIFIFGLYNFLLRAPLEFPINRIFEIKKGDNLISISKRLKKENFIYSEYLFRIEAKKKKQEQVVAGRYIFKERVGLERILKIFSEGESLKEYQKFVIFEGEPNYIIAERLSKKMKNIDKNIFLKKAARYEGMLYPDTYNLDPNFNEEDVLKFFLKNFEKKISENNISIPDQERLKILIIASLVEAEAGRAKYEDKRHVAGIIFNRLKKEMPLQLDYVFFYIQKVNKQKLSSKAIERIIWKGKKIDSPFNNYKYIGLPPNPISNPHIDSIKAALNPSKTNDLYYITGKDGKFYYAKTGSKHYKNIKKYLK